MIHQIIEFKSRIVLILVFMCLALLGCQPSARNRAESLFTVNPDGFNLYNFNKPDAKYKLPYILEEISGMDYFSPGVIACVQDEDGKVFLYNHQKKEIVKTVRFASSGDYEGLAVNGNKIYVAESNGNIYKFKITDSEKPEKLKKYKTKLKKNNDVEGLAFDHQFNKLIIACKGDAGLNGKEEKGRGFYYFDMDEHDVGDKPLFRITKSNIKNFLEQYIDFEYETRRINFRPSAIAIHPISDYLYILASVGKLLLVTDRKGEIKASYPIDPRLMGQPEGICFSPNGDLYISSEGQGDKGYILKFKMKK